MSEAGPTIIRIDFDRLDSSANRLEEVGHSAEAARRAMGSSPVGPGAFGLMNAPLGVTTALVASHAERLTGELATVAPRVANNARFASRSWREVETEATATLARLGSLIGEAEQQ